MGLLRAIVHTALRGPRYCAQPLCMHARAMPILLGTLLPLGFLFVPLTLTEGTNDPVVAGRYDDLLGSLLTGRMLRH